MLSVEFLECKMADLQIIVHEFQEVVKTTPGKIDSSYHHIPTTGPPVHVPPRCIIPAHRDEVLHQLQSMLDQGIIEWNNSPWIAPAVYLYEKKSEEICLCIDYGVLNK